MACNTPMALCESSCGTQRRFVQGLVHPSWCCEPRPAMRPRAPLLPSKPTDFYLVQLPLRGLPQIGVHCAPKGHDQGIRIHNENSVYSENFFQRSVNSQSLRTWTHSSPVTRRERKQWRNTRIVQRHTCATWTSGHFHASVGVVVYIICFLISHVTLWSTPSRESSREGLTNIF